MNSHSGVRKCKQYIASHFPFDVAKLWKKRFSCAKTEEVSNEKVQVAGISTGCEGMEAIDVLFDKLSRSKVYAAAQRRQHGNRCLRFFVGV